MESLFNDARKRGLIPAGVVTETFEQRKSLLDALHKNDQITREMIKAADEASKNDLVYATIDKNEVIRTKAEAEAAAVQTASTSSTSSTSQGGRRTVSSKAAEEGGRVANRAVKSAEEQRAEQEARQKALQEEITKKIGDGKK